VAVLKDSPDLNGKRFAASIAFVKTDPGAFAVHLADTIFTPAMRTNRKTLRPNPLFHERISGFFIVKVRGGKV
jgi:hypothetical protein